MTQRLPKVCYDFIRDVKRRADKAGIKFLIDKKQPYVEVSGSQCNGYFCDETKILAVGQGNRPHEEWFLTFIHESCHMDQWTEKDPVWTVGVLDPEEEVNTWDLLDYWYRGWIELTAKQRDDYHRFQFLIEQDCEKRSIARIKEWGLPYDTDLYARKANAYLYFYRMLSLRRKWYTIGNEPYNIPAILDLMPTEIIEWDSPFSNAAKAEYRKIM